MNRPRATTWFLGAAVVAVLASGCSSADDAGATRTASVTTTSGLGTTTSSAVASPKPTVISKAVGEQAGYGCSSTQTGCSDLLAFTVSDVSIAKGCSAEPPAGKKFLHVAVSASVSSDTPPDRETDAGLMLLTTNWRVVGSDGFSSTDLDVGTACEFDPGPFYNQMPPGTKQRGDVVFEVPENARTLELRSPAVRGGWAWSIPAA